MVQQTSRRQLLRGLGVSLALPFLESLPAHDADNRSTTAPQRLVIMFFGNGVSADHWWAKGKGAHMELGECLAPLQAFRTRLNVINGLWNENATKGTIHSAQTGNLLSGATLAKGGRIRIGESFDQVLAKRLGTDTPIPSMVLGCEKAQSGIHKGYAAMYSGHICWKSASNPVPVEYYPAVAFDRLFNNQMGQHNQRILDRIRGEATTLSKQLGQADRYKLDEYLTSVHELDKRLQVLRKPADASTWQPSRRDPDRERPAAGIPKDVKSYHDIMRHIMVLALQTNKTRFATLMLNNDLSSMFFPHLGLNAESHHTMSHASRRPAFKRATRYFVEQYATTLKTMAAIDEGGSSLLDNSCVMLCSSIFNGSGHDARQVPMLLAGGLGGHLSGGRVLNYRDAGDDKRKLCSLYLSLMDRMGVELEAFGDARQRLAGF